MQVREAPVLPNSGNELTVVLSALRALKKGDHTVRLPLEWEGTAGMTAVAFNEIAEINQRMTEQMTEMLSVLRALKRGDV